MTPFGVWRHAALRWDIFACSDQRSTLFVPPDHGRSCFLLQALRQRTRVAERRPESHFDRPLVELECTVHSLRASWQAGEQHFWSRPGGFWTGWLAKEEATVLDRRTPPPLRNRSAGMRVDSALGPSCARTWLRYWRTTSCDGETRRFARWTCLPSRPGLSVSLSLCRWWPLGSLCFHSFGHSFGRSCRLSCYRPMSGRAAHFWTDAIAPALEARVSDLSCLQGAKESISIRCLEVAIRVFIARHTFRRRLCHPTDINAMDLLHG